MVARSVLERCLARASRTSDRADPIEKRGPRWRERLCGRECAHAAQVTSPAGRGSSLRGHHCSWFEIPRETQSWRIQEKSSWRHDARHDGGGNTGGSDRSPSCANPASGWPAFQAPFDDATQGRCRTEPFPGVRVTLECKPPLGRACEPLVAKEGCAGVPRAVVRFSPDSPGSTATATEDRLSALGKGRSSFEP